MKLKKGPFRLFMKACALLGHMIFSKPFAVLSAIVLIYTLGGLTGHLAAGKAIAIGDWCSDKWDGGLKKATVAFRLETTADKVPHAQEYIPKAYVVDGIITGEGDEQYFFDDGTVLPPPEDSENDTMSVNLPVE